MAANVDRHGQRRFGSQPSQQPVVRQRSGSDPETSPVSSRSSSDSSDASITAGIGPLSASGSSWSHMEDSHAAVISGSHDGIHPDWIVPSSPPSPPLRYDPRCRASSPETPCPLYVKRRKPANRNAALGLSIASHSGPDSHPPSSILGQDQNQWSSPSPLHSAPLSTASSCLSSSGYSATSASENAEALHSVSMTHLPAGFTNHIATHHLHMPDARMAIPPGLSLHRAYAGDTLASRSPRPQLSHTGDSGVPIYSNWPTGTANSERCGHVPSIPHPQLQHGSLQDPPRTSGLSYSTALGPRARPGLAKLSRFREPTSSGKKRVIHPAKHAHKRSYSVQWQQFQRWQSKSRARLRDLLLLLLAMATGTIVMWHFCLNSGRQAPHSRRRGLDIQHLAALPEPHRDTMVIYRILGNDLPPRHEVGQTLRNLRFMLSHENDFTRFGASSFSPYNLKVDKYYILNRITNETAVDAIMALFAEYQVPLSRVLNIPFDLQEYKRQEMRWDGGVAVSRNLWGVGSPDEANVSASLDTSADDNIPDTFESKEKRTKKSLITKLRAMEYATHDKNLYAINNNGGRNYALEHGRSLAKARWILPLDGNCFLTPSAMVALMQSMASDAEGPASKRHIIVPMNRLLNNQDVFDDNVPPWATGDVKLQDLDIPTFHAPEEPQVGFRWDSPISYQPSMRYGRRSKLELLWRLGAIPFSRGLHIKRLPWEKQDHLYITPSSYASAVNASVSQRQTKHGITDGDFIKAGWVHRLFSGDTSQEYSTTRAAELRRLNRMRGIITYLEDLDVKASQALSDPAIDFPARLWTRDTRELLAVRRDITDGRISAREISKLYQASGKLVKRLMSPLGSASTTDETLVSNENILKDSLHLASIGYVMADDQLIQAAVKTAMHVLPTVSKDRYSADIDYGHTLVGYSFPSLPTKLFGYQTRMILPYNPFQFDVTSLVDIFRLVRLNGSKAGLGSTQKAWIKEVEAALGRHLRMLLLSKEGIDLSSTPPSFESAIKYDTSVTVLSGYFGISSLVSRVRTRHQLRYVDPATGEAATEMRDPFTTNLYENFKKGLDNVALASKGENQAGLSVKTSGIIEELAHVI